jgi:hypothetical protein
VELKNRFLKFNRSDKGIEHLVLDVLKRHLLRVGIAVSECSVVVVKADRRILGPMLGFFKYFRRKIQQKHWRF